ncbi:hypothetical protein BDV11DRAFT_55633 [Aspergillus similis]
MAASIAPECNDLKEKYDTCFLKWYSEKYLRGNTGSNECEELFAKYKSCLTKKRGRTRRRQTLSTIGGHDGKREPRRTAYEFDNVAGVLRPVLNRLELFISRSVSPITRFFTPLAKQDIDGPPSPTCILNVTTVYDIFCIYSRRSVSVI